MRRNSEKIFRYFLVSISMTLLTTYVLTFIWKHLFSYLNGIDINHVFIPMFFTLFVGTCLCFLVVLNNISDYKIDRTFVNSKNERPSYYLVATIFLINVFYVFDNYMIIKNEEVKYSSLFSILDEKVLYKNKSQVFVFLDDCKVRSSIWKIDISNELGLAISSKKEFFLGTRNTRLRLIETLEKSGWNINYYNVDTGKKCY